MAEQSKPNTFSGGMITDLDPAYQPKESYFTGLNIRVITNGDKSYSLENMKGPKSSYITNRYKSDVEATDPTLFLSGNDRCVIHGAAIVDDYVITIEATVDTTSKTWKIRKYTIDSATGDVDNADGFNTTEPKHLWSGTELFSDDAGKIEIEAIVETESVHRIYCTDGILGLRSINVMDSGLSGKTVTDFKAFKPNVKSKISLVEYGETGGNLKYGSYSYVYRLGSQSQSNYTDWSSVSRPINVVKNDLVNNTSLGVSGGSSAERSSAAIKLKIQNISQDYGRIQIATIFYSSENVSSISVVEEGSITSADYTFTHSGFETETLVEGGIAAAIISNETWSVCKSLAQKDNKLYAANLKSDLFDIDSIIDGLGKLKSYKGVEDGNGDWSLISDYEGDFNPHRHYNGSGGNWSWSDNLDDDKGIYKFINKNFTSDNANPTYVLGAETVNFSTTDADGFRLTFDQIPYRIDERFNEVPGGGSEDPTTDQDGNELYFLGSSNNDNNFGGFKPGPHNPVWDSKYRSFKRGECYRFGIVFYDKLGTPGFTHFLGDVKMPDALDPNSQKLDNTGSNAVDKDNHSDNCRWSPFSGGSTENDVMAYALIPRIEVRLPSTVTSQISGYKIVRAELTDNDKTIITQGLLNTVEGYEAIYGNNDTLDGKAVYAPTSLTIVRSTDNESNSNTGYPTRIEQKQYTIDGTDTTFRNIAYNYTTGFAVRPLYPMMANKVNSSTSSPANHKYFGYDLKSDMDSGGQDGVGFGVQKWKPYARILANTTSQTDVSALQTNDGENLFRWYRDTYLAKTVVNTEIVTTTQNGLGIDYIHKAPGYDGEDQMDGDEHSSSGDFAARDYGDQSRSQYSLDVNSSLYVSTNSSGNIPLLASVKFGGTANKSFHQYDSNGHAAPLTYRASHWPGDGGQYSYRFLGFKWMAELIRDTSNEFEQYGGSTDAAIEDTRFYDCSDFVNTSASSTYSTQITFGDVFCDWYTMQNTSRDSTADTYVYGSVFPVESYVNVALRQGTYLGSGAEVSMLTLDNFLYNTAYSQENNLLSSVVKPTGFVDNDLFKAKIAVSKTKILGELFDAWTVFPSNDFIELNLSNGKISDLVNYKNQLYSVQDSGIALLSVNSRALIQGEGAAADIQIVTGTGTAIERYDYLTTQYGSQHFNEAIISPSAFYLFDADKAEIIKCDGQSVTPTSLANSYKSYIVGLTKDKNILKSKDNNLGSLTEGLFTGYDNEFRECYFTVVDDNGGNNSFIISDLDGKLISELELFSDETIATSGAIFFKKYISYKNRLYGVGHETATDSNDVIYLFNSDVYQNFSVGVVVNDNPTVSKIFDTSEIISDIDTIFTSHTLLDSTSSGATTGSNERVREGIHRVSLRGESTGRARGTWLKHTIDYSQTTVSDSIDSSNDKKFNIFAINTKFRNSR